MGRKLGQYIKFKKVEKIYLKTSIGTQVAVSMKEPVIGRQISEGDIFYTDLTSKEAKLLLESFSHRLGPEEQEVFQHILSKKREADPSFGYI